MQAIVLMTHCKMTLLMHRMLEDASLCVVISTPEQLSKLKMTTLDLLTFRILLMSLRREHTWVPMFPKGATVMRLPPMALGEKSCWSYVGLLNY